jgi:multicomponent Na+:H+ antiporter subunit G
MELIEIIQTTIVILLLLLSSFFLMVGTIGLIRMPDAFCKMHATTKSDTLGAGLALLALIVYKGFHPISIKLFFIILFIWITNSTGAHIIAKATYYRQNKIEKS